MEACTQSNSVQNVKLMPNNEDQRMTNEELISLVIKCTNFSAIKHSRQRRKNKEQTPYINHPIGVANILVEEGAIYDPNVILAALLHDTVEDTDTTFEEIEKIFGERVKIIVQEVTDDKSLPSADRKRLQVEHSKNISYEAKLVKLADKLYNLRDLQKEIPVGWTVDRKNAYFKWSEDVINECRGTNDKLECLLDETFEKHRASLAT